MLPWPPCLDSPRLFLRICALKAPIWGQNPFEVPLEFFNFFDTILSKLPIKTRDYQCRSYVQSYKGPFKYYVIKEVGGWGGQMMMFDDKVVGGGG